MKKFLPWIFVAVFAFWFLGGVQAPKQKDGYNIADFGRLPVLLNGRVQPLDSVARNTLLVISGRSTVPYGPEKSVLGMKYQDRMTPSQWLLEAMTQPNLANTRKIFRIQHPDLEGLMGTDKVGLQYYSFDDLTNQLQHIEEQARTIINSEEDKGEDAEKLRTPFQKDLMHLYNSLVLFDRVKSSIEPEGTQDFQEELAAYQEAIVPGRAALKLSENEKDQSKLTPEQQDALQRIAIFFRRYEEVSKLAYPLIVPPAPGQPKQAWSNAGTNLLATLKNGEVSEPMKRYAAITAAVKHNEPAKFNQSVADYRAWLDENQLFYALKKGDQEYFFNQIEPFYKSMVIYVAAALLGCFFWLNMSEWLRKSGFALLVLAFIIHTIGLFFRMYLEGRPPVTNLYSSAIFIGWGSTLLGIILERIFKGAIGLVCAGFIGFTTLIIAHHLALSGDTMEMLRAVLDTNLWLSTHVVAVTTGYASMFVAGILAIIYIVRGFFTRSLSPEMGKALSRMVYGIVCFSTLFSFVGTVLGGIWADQSWGRFWGWDPKENGALLIVIWNAVILHARWGGLIRERGLMAMAVFGNIVTSFSWFGVNMLGIGLHSYGFMDKAFPWLVGFDISQVVLIVLACMPVAYWASFKDAAAESEPPSGGARPLQPALN
jgi:ABC-type transport system involved in cytochrome c biogenesis permease subunit